MGEIDMAILAFDFGGSSVKYGLWNGREILNQGKFETPDNWETMKAKLFAVFEQHSEGIEGIAFSVPGIVENKERKILGISAIPYIHQVNFFDDLETLFKLPISVENDANCAGIAELSKGVAVGKSEVVFVVIGTGIGGAVFHNGQLYRGAHHYCGEFGLNYLDGEKTFSEIGTVVNMVQRYCQKKGLRGQALSGEEVFLLAEQGDVLAQEEVENFYNYLSKGLCSIQFTLDPELIVLGGGVSIKEGLIEEINQRVMKKMGQSNLDIFMPEIVASKFGNNANLIGAVSNFLMKVNRE